MGTEAGFGIVFFLISLLIMVVSFGGLAFWIWMLVDVLKIPDGQFKGAGTEKLTWGLVVGLVGWIGGLIWYFGPRKRVHAAPNVAPPPALQPAGWFPDPGGSGRMRYFDGAGWTQHYQ